MEMKKKSLNRFFTEYTTKVIAIPIVLGIFLLILTFFTLQIQIFHPANYEQNIVSEITPLISKAARTEDNMIPAPLEYIILNKNGTDIISTGNMKNRYIDDALEFVKNKKAPSGLDNPFFSIIESQNDICVIRYSIILKFANPTLQKLIPYPGLTIAILTLIIFIALLLLLSRNTAKNLRAEVDKLLRSTEKIKANNLDFSSEANEFKEFHAVADSLDQLRDALKLSLSEQIELEQSKTEQISSLAHDIKIPVTIIKGNAELLEMMNQHAKENEITADIISASNQIEIYIQNLIDTVKFTSTSLIQKKPVSWTTFLKKLEQEATALARSSHCHFELHHSLSEQLTFKMDEQYLYRAFLNIIINGFEHSPAGKSLKLNATKCENTITFQLQDQGEGFSKEALKNAMTLFFTEDKARTGTHHGIGLNFASKAIAYHGGELTIQNNSLGAHVTIILPLHS